MYLAILKKHVGTDKLQWFFSAIGLLEIDNFKRRFGHFFILLYSSGTRECLYFDYDPLRKVALWFINNSC